MAVCKDPESTLSSSSTPSQVSPAGEHSVGKKQPHSMIKQWTEVYSDEQTGLNLEIRADSHRECLEIRFIEIINKLMYRARITSSFCRGLMIPEHLTLKQTQKKIAALMQRGTVTIDGDDFNKSLTLSYSDHDLSDRFSSALSFHSTPLSKDERIEYWKKKVDYMLDDREKVELLTDECEEKTDEIESLKGHIRSLEKALEMMTEECEELRSQNERLTKELAKEHKLVSSKPIIEKPKSQSSLSADLEALTQQFLRRASAKIDDEKSETFRLSDGAQEILGELTIEQLISEDHPKTLDALAEFCGWDKTDERDGSGDPRYLVKLWSYVTGVSNNPMQMMHAKYLFLHRNAVGIHEECNHVNALEICAMTPKLLSILGWFLKEGSIHPSGGITGGSLYWAAFTGNEPAARMLLADHRVDKDRANSIGVTPLMGAAERNQFSMISLLLKYGCDTTQKNHAGLTALDIAIQEGHSEVMALLESVEAPRGFFAV